MTHSRFRSSVLALLVTMGLIALAVTALPISQASAEASEKVTICHNPGANEVTVEVSVNSWSAHEAHGDEPFDCVRLVVICDNPPPDDPIATVELNEGESFGFTLDVRHEDFCRVLYQSTGEIIINGTGFFASPGGFTLDPRQYTEGIHQIEVTSIQDANVISIKLND